MTWILAVCDRTGQLLDAVESVADGQFEDTEAVAVPHGPGLDGDDTDADVLVLGGRELTSVGLRRATMWLDRHPGAAALAHLDDTVATLPSRDDLLAAGISDWYEGPVDDLDALADALEALGAAVSEVIDQTLAAPVPVPVAAAPVAKASAKGTGKAPAKGAKAAGGAATARAQPADAVEYLSDLMSQDQGSGTGPSGGVLFGGAEDLPAGNYQIHSDGESAYVITVASASGGSGKTFYAANLASFLADQGHRVVLVDLDLQFGEVGAALQIKHPYSIYDGLYDGRGEPLPDDALDQHLAELVHHSVLGFDVLLAPRDPTVGELITAEDVELVVAVAAGRYDVVLLDTPPALTETVLSVLDRSDVVTVLSTLDVPSLRNLTSFLDVLRRIDVGRDRVKLILNKVESDIGIDVSQAQEAFGGRFVATLPAAKSASRSINTGTVVLRSEPKSPLSRALISSMHTILPPELRPATGPASVGEDAGADADPSSTTAKGWRNLFRSRRSVPGGNP